MIFDYPYTDMHELNLDWFLAKFKDLVETWNNVESEWNSLHDYVQNYFENLNVQTEIDNKINAMILNGTFADIVSPFVTAALPALVAGQLPDVVAAQISSVVAAQISAVVADQLPAVAAAAAAQEVGTWLAAHIDPDTGYVIDDTLTVSQAAADSKTVGDKLAVDEAGLAQLESIKDNRWKNLFDFTDADIIDGQIYDHHGQLVSNASFITSGYIPALPYHNYTNSTWSTSSSAYVTFFDNTKTYLTTKNPSGYGYVTAPAGAAYVRFGLSKVAIYNMGFTEGKENIPRGMPYNVFTLIDQGISPGHMINGITDLHDLVPYDTAATGILKRDGTIDSGYTLSIWKFKDLPGVVYLDGASGMSYNNTWAHAWYVKNGVMVAYIPDTSALQEYDKVAIYPSSLFDEIWVMKTGTLRLKQPGAIDRTCRNVIDNFGGQWSGKSWYAYGTSITSVHENTGKYPTYLQQMSGMTLTEKGIGGGGIGDLGAYSQGQVYDAICNITDGKLDADIITLETGANDVNSSVPLGTIYDTGRTTLAGCLNDCIRYLQTNTSAQIVIIPSPATTTAPNAASQYYTWAAMIEEICNLNRVHFVNNNCNEGYAKLSGLDGSDYVVDNIHQTDLGGYCMAENIWYQLRNIPIFRTVLPS